MVKSSTSRFPFSVNLNKISKIIVTIKLSLLLGYYKALPYNTGIMNGTLR